MDYHWYRCNQIFTYISTFVSTNHLRKACLSNPFIIVMILGLTIGSKALAQSLIKPAKAAAYSILVPGLGHKYVNDGRWSQHAVLYTITDALLVAGLIASEWQRGYLVNSYQTWATSYAGVSNEGKDRRFYVTIGNYISSDEYREVQLRSRRVDLMAYVDPPDFQWTWHNIQDLQRYRDLRKSSESWSQSSGSFIAALVANRLIAGLSALLAARRKQNQAIQVAVSPGPTVQIAFTL